MKLTRSVCTSCGFAGAPTIQTPGSFLIEIILWFVFLVPGIIYSIWRISSKHEACPSCGHRTMIPASAPRAKELLAATGWSVGAEEHYQKAARMEWRGQIPWVVISTTFALLFFGADAPRAGYFAAVIDLALILRLWQTRPR